MPKTNNFFAKSGHTCNEQEKGRRSESNVKFLYSDNFHKLYSLQSGKQQALNTNLDNVIFTNPFSKMTFLRRFRPSVLDASTILDVVMLDLRRHRGHRWDGPRFVAGRSRPSASPWLTPMEKPPSCSWWLTDKRQVSIFFKKKCAIPDLFFFIFVFSTQLTVNKCLMKVCQCLDSNCESLVFGGDRSTNWATTTAQLFLICL